jgi:hypothetical protein
MIRLFVRVLPYALVVFGGLATIGNIVTVLAPGPSEPTPVAVSQVERDGAASHRFIAASDGLLDWDGAISVYEKRRSPGSIERTTDYFVPLVSPGPDRPHFAVFVRFTPEDFVETFPGGADAHGNSGPTPFDARGVIETSSVLLPGPFKEYIASDLEMPLDRVIVINHGARPTTRTEAVFGGLASLAVALGGGAWLKSRARLRVAVLGVASAADVRDGIRDDPAAPGSGSAF